jgi:hypothetical protein
MKGEIGRCSFAARFTVPFPALSCNSSSSQFTDASACFFSISAVPAAYSILLRKQSNSQERMKQSKQR